MIQFATAVTSWVGAKSPTRNLALSRQVAAGTAAAMAAVYQSLIAGVFFAIEIVLGEWAWKGVLSLLMASLFGWTVSRLFLGAGPLLPVSGSLHLTLDLLWILPFAFLFGVPGPVYQKTLHYSRVTGQWQLLPVIVPYTLIASYIAHVLSPPLLCTESQVRSLQDDCWRDCRLDG